MYGLKLRIISIWINLFEFNLVYFFCCLHFLISIFISFYISFWSLHNSLVKNVWMINKIHFSFILFHFFLCFISFTVIILFDLFVFHLFYFYTYFFYLLFNFGTIIFHRISWLKHKCKSLESFSRIDIIASYFFKHLRIFFKNMFNSRRIKIEKIFLFLWNAIQWALFSSTHQDL